MRSVTPNGIPVFVSWIGLTLGATAFGGVLGGLFLVLKAILTS
jgi:hypothetical protein